MQADGTLVFAAEPSFQKLMGRIGDIAESRSLLGAPTSGARLPGMSARPRARAGVAQWLAAAVVLEAACLGFGAWAWHAHPVATGPYVTLTSAAPSYRAGPRIRIVFRAGLSVQGLGSLLRQAGAHIIDGPSAANVYTLGFTDASITPGVVAAALRANADVLFAEPQAAAEDVVGSEGR
jgi:hypothetical protein